MSRTAKVGLFVLMGLVIALARLIEVEVSRLRLAPDCALDATAALGKPGVVAPKRAGSSRGSATTVTAGVPKLKAEKAVEKPATAPEEGSAEWPRGPFYTVKKGETLAEISQKVLGSAKHWQRLYDANVARVPNLKAVRPGTRLVVPGGGTR